jgi:hypothetical protein
MKGAEHGGRRTTRAIVISLIAGVAIVATAGIAGGALKTKQAQVSIAAGETKSATAKCKQGTRAVSGGFDSPDFDIAFVDSIVSPNGSFRSSKREWTSTGTDYPGANEPGTLISYAYCSDELPKLKTKSEQTTIPNGAFGSLTVRCPKGGEAVSGGFEAPGSGANQVQQLESRRKGKRKWVVTGTGTGSDDQLIGFAYCAKHKLGLKTKVASASTDQDSVPLSEKARCKKGQQAVSGGFGTEVDVLEGGYTQPLQSRRAGKRGWQAVAANYSGDLPVTWNVYVYCLEKDPKG